MAFRSTTFNAVFLLLVAFSTNAEADQKESDTSCDSSAPPASLLQKVVHNHGKTTISQEQNKQTPVCTGVTAQGRCWYLSETGDNCANTCRKYGKELSFVVADVNNPITPMLVGHVPKTKQDPWAIFECYAASEDRYHPANANAANHFTSDVGSWSNKECKLACPCGGENENALTQCTWKQPPACAPTFMYKGVVYTGCVTVDSDHDKPWCQHHYQEQPIQVQDWSYCEQVCTTPGSSPVPVPVAPPTNTGCGWKPAPSCVPEFDFQGTHYVGCTLTDHDTPWCSNTVRYQGSWSQCTYSCDRGITKPVSPTVVDNTQCSYQPAPDCAQSFEYKGTQYTGCVDVDYPTPWCSNDRIHRGVWTVCNRVCGGTPALPVTPVSPAVEEPCTRRPDLENDMLGYTAPLNEVGYQMASSANSPVNMKRFVCRTVNKIGCKVIDLPSLMAFVPSYSGLVNRRSYAFLENELSTLCKTGGPGKWVVPMPMQ